MLGVWIAPNGSNTKLVNELRHTALDWNSKVQLGNPSQKEAWLALHTTITAKLKYPLSACTLSSKECKSIMYPVIRIGLPKSGFSSRLCRAIRDCPSACGGAGVLSLFYHQGTSRTAMYVEQVHRKTTTGMLLLQNTEELVLETGLYGSLWKMSFEDISTYVSGHSLIYHMLSYNNANNIQINVNHTERSPKRTGDQSIMETALTYFHYSKDLKAIQRVRMFLGLLSLSDICNTSGTSLDISFYSTKQTYRQRSNSEWPIKQHVYKTDYIVWRKLLKFIFSNESYTLYQPLGHWTILSNKE